MAISIAVQNIITSKEFEKLKTELYYRVNVLREEIKVELKEAGDLGDAPENFPFDAAVAKQRINERKIQELEGFLRECIVKDNDSNVKNKSSKVKIGDSVEIEKEDGRKLMVKIVTPDILVVNKERGYISSESELGKKLLKKKVGEIFEVKTPVGKSTYKILQTE